MDAMGNSYIHLGMRIQRIQPHDQPAEVTPNGGVVRESPQNPLNSGLGIILICPE